MKLPVMFKTSLLLSCKRNLSVLCVEVWRRRVQGVAESPKISLLISLRVLIKLKMCMGLWCGHTSSCKLARELRQSSFFSDTRQPDVDFKLFFDSGFAHILGQIVSSRVKTLSITNSVASRHIKRKNTSLLVDVDQEWRCADCWVTHIWQFAFSFADNPQKKSPNLTFSSVAPKMTSSRLMLLAFDAGTGSHVVIDGKRWSVFLISLL